MADEIKQKEISSVKNPAFGRSRGVFAALINSITSGSIFCLWWLQSIQWSVQKAWLFYY